MDLSELQELNLSQGQIAVYQAVLELGISSLQGIQEKTGIERRNIYDILNKLIEKGFVSYTIEQGKRTYQCTHPTKLQEEIHKKQQELQQLEEKIPAIVDFFTAHKPDIRAEVLRGNEAIKSYLEEALTHKASYWIGGNSGVEISAGLDMKNWFKHWMKRRVEKGHIMHDLVDHGTWLEGLEPEYITKHKEQLYKYYQLPKHFQSPMVMVVFGNKVAQILWSKQTFAFVLESPEIKESFMKYFHYFWKDPW